MLKEIGNKHGTDKGNECHTIDGESYLDIYDKLFHSVRESVQTLAEIGVRGGNSVTMWREYFPKAHIWGLDIDPTINTDFGERINVIIGDQSSATDLDKLAPGSKLDVVIDDGSHLADHLEFTFNHLWPRVSAGGFYVMEDTTCTNGDTTDYIEKWPGQKYNKAGTKFNNDRQKLNQFILQQIHDAENGRKDVQSVMVCFNMIWFKKRKPQGNPPPTEADEGLAAS